MYKGFPSCQCHQTLVLAFSGLSLQSEWGGTLPFLSVSLLLITGAKKSMSGPEITKFYINRLWLCVLFVWVLFVLNNIDSVTQ